MIVVMIITALLNLSHMGPAFVAAVSEAINTSNEIAAVGVLHGIIGAVALAMGIWLFWVWAINEGSNTKFCVSRKKMMWKILSLWLLSLGLGGFYYCYKLILADR